MTAPLPRPLVWPCENDWCVGFLHVGGHDDAAIREVVVIISGGTQTRVGAHRHLWQLAQALTTPDRAILRFDRRGTGDSSGPAASFEQLDAEIFAAVAAVNQALPQRPRIVLLGHCDGASAALLATARGLRIAQLILLNPWARTADTAAAAALGHHYGARLTSAAAWARVLRGEVHVGRASASLFKSLAARFGSRSRTSAGFLGQRAQAWSQLSCPVTVVLGQADATAQEFDLVRRAWAPPAAFRVEMIPDGDHSFSDAHAEQQLIQALQTALSRPVE